MLPDCYECQKKECPSFLIIIPPRQRPNSLENMEDPVEALERNQCGHPLVGLLWERHFEEVLVEKGWEKVPAWAIRAHKAQIILICVRGRCAKSVGKKQNMKPGWKIMQKEIDLEDQTPLIKCFWVAHKERQRLILERYSPKLSSPQR